MIDYKYSDLFKKDNVKKDLILDFKDFQITNNRLYAEEFELSESLCSENELRFGCCEASVVKFKCRNEFGELKGKPFNILIALGGNVDEPLQKGVYKVFSSEPSGDRLYTKITAYDAMYDVINAEMVEWYDNLPFPVTLKYFRDSFFNQIGIRQVETSLVNDGMTIEKTIDADSISGKQIITAICELNGVFGHINHSGFFEYVSLMQRNSRNYEEALYPSEHLYPSEELFPLGTTIRDYEHVNIGSSKYKTCEYEDFETERITKLQIRQEENDIGVIVGEGSNTYIVQDNFLVYGKSSEELTEIANRLYLNIVDVFYRPFKATLQGNLCIEVGDSVVFHTKYKEIESYVLQRTIKGIQSLKDTFESEGVYEYAEKVNSPNKEMKKLKGKTNVLERTVEKLSSEINDEETGLKTKIEQTSEKVEVMAGDNYVSSKISVELGKVVLKGNRVVIESDNFSLDEEGNVTINGVFTQTDENGVESIAIENNQMKFYDWEGNGDYVGSVGSTKNFSSGRVGLSVWCDSGDYVDICCKTDTNIMPVIKVDGEKYDTEPPWIRNTVSELTVFPDNPNGGLVFKNGLLTKGSLKAVTGTLFPNNPNGGINVVNGLITGWNLFRIADSTLSIVSGVGVNSEGYIDRIHFADVVIKDGLIISWTRRTQYIQEGDIY